jgi:hypothetical protein
MGCPVANLALNRKNNLRNCPKRLRFFLEMIQHGFIFISLPSLRLCATKMKQLTEVTPT